MNAIFLSYRRADSQDVVGRLYEHLVSHFPVSSVFRDLDSIPLGRPFPEVLKEALTRTGVGIVVMGPRWLSIEDTAGIRRLGDPNDYVRQEIEALLSMDIPVIPCLISHSPMPDAEDLPESLRPLTTRHYLQLRPDPDFRHDVECLVSYIAKVVSLDTQSSVPNDGKLALELCDVAVKRSRELLELFAILSNLVYDGRQQTEYGVQIQTKINESIDPWRGALTQLATCPSLTGNQKVIAALTRLYEVVRDLVNTKHGSLTDIGAAIAELERVVKKSLVA